ncbi:hypothetical protein [Pseudomonas sp. Gutcm_11s]|uniref:hypothetical protein n=1 Tax=Pseudomonas sp. Gutcm_11s TaxID=3026088 RepID=UPI00235E4156|nr:hypothetical protein [Pseudomonas sp. Gutcm_11s]MDD0843357.1 hypothetical protein [Pseudomonas sp. Gutcm_11s]
MTMTKRAWMLGLSALLAGCSFPLKPNSGVDLARAGRHQEAAKSNLSEARRSEEQRFWSSAASYYLMAADNYRQSTSPDREFAALTSAQRAASQAWQQPEEITDSTPRAGALLAQAESRLAEYWQTRDQHKALEHYQELLARQDDIRMLYSGPGLELSKAASRSEALGRPTLTMQLYLFGLSGQYAEEADLYQQLASRFARAHGYSNEAQQLQKRQARVKQLQADPNTRQRDASAQEQLRVAALKSSRYASLGEMTLAAVYADQQARQSTALALKRSTAEVEQGEALRNKGLKRLASTLAAVGTTKPSRQVAARQVSDQSAAAVNGCIQISSGGPNTITLINNCNHNVGVAWCYMPAPGALQSDKHPLQANQICIHNGTDFPSVVLGRSAVDADLSKTHHSWELPYSQNTIYHIACNAGADGKGLPRVTGFDDNLQGSCPALTD